MLGAIMLSRDAYDLASEIISADCFYSDAHKAIFKVFQKLSRKRQPIDLFTVANELHVDGMLEQIGGAHTITALTNSVVSDANVEQHCKIIFQKYMNREMIRLSAELYNRAFSDEDSFELLDYAEKELAALDSTTASGMVRIDKVVMEAMNQIDMWRAMDSDITGVPSGFEGLDVITRGWQPGDLILIGARPSVGKTALALNLVKNAAQNSIKPVTVAVWSLEMKAMFLVLRMLAAESKTFLDRLQTGNISQDEMNQIMRGAAKTLSELGIYFDEKSSVSISSIIRKAKRLKKTDNLGLIVIDYLQLVLGDDKKVREQQIASISRELKNLASDLGIPIIALSQLSRESGTKGINWESGPPVSALRESGALEQDADVIAMVWGPSDEDIAQNPTLKKRRKVRVVKQRNGVLGTIEFDFRNEIQLFESIQDTTSAGFRTAGPVRNYFTDAEDDVF